MTFVDFACRLKGGPIPADHGYSLYSALTKILPALHPPKDQALGVDQAKGEAPLWLSAAIHPIRGKLIGSRQLSLTAESRLTIRMPSGRLEEVLPLAGRELLLDGCKVVCIGAPEILPLVARPRLYSRLVVIKGATDPEHFLQTAATQLAALGIHAELGIPYKRSGSRVEGAPSEGDEPKVLRRTLRIADRTIIGFALAANGLSADESITLQEQGLGGRRRFGCGVFIPAVA